MSRKNSLRFFLWLCRFDIHSVSDEMVASSRCQTTSICLEIERRKTLSEEQYSQYKHRFK